MNNLNLTGTPSSEKEKEDEAFSEQSYDNNVNKGEVNPTTSENETGEVISTTGNELEKEGEGEGVVNFTIGNPGESEGVVNTTTGDGIKKDEGFFDELKGESNTDPVNNVNAFNAASVNPSEKNLSNTKDEIRNLEKEIDDIKTNIDRLNSVISGLTQNKNEKTEKLEELKKLNNTNNTVEALNDELKQSENDNSLTLGSDERVKNQDGNEVELTTNKSNIQGSSLDNGAPNGSGVESSIGNGLAPDSSVVGSSIGNEVPDGSGAEPSPGNGLAPGGNVVESPTPNEQNQSGGARVIRRGRPPGTRSRTNLFLSSRLGKTCRRSHRSLRDLFF